jgi:hypothetical protein
MMSALSSLTSPAAVSLSESRLTRRRTSAGPTPPNRPVRFGEPRPVSRGGPRPTYLTLVDHGKVYVTDLPQLSDGQLDTVGQEAESVLDSLQRRIAELEEQLGAGSRDDSMIRACTKRDVTERFLRAIADERQRRQLNPHLRTAAAESLARAFMEVARHRLPGSTFDSLLQEALTACEAREDPGQEEESLEPLPILPVVLSPELG